MKKFISGTISDFFLFAILALLGVGIWIVFGKVVTGGTYSIDYWAYVQGWFWALFIFGRIIACFMWAIEDLK